MRLTKAKRREILKESLGTKRKFNMSSFFDTDSDHELSAMITIMARGEVIEEVCGTACCLAGEAACLFPQDFARVSARFNRIGKKFYLHGRFGGPETAKFSAIAANVLGVKQETFFVDNWPQERRLEYSTASNEQRKEIAIQVLDELTVRK